MDAVCWRDHLESFVNQIRKDEYGEPHDEPGRHGVSVAPHEKCHERDRHAADGIKNDVCKPSSIESHSSQFLVDASAQFFSKDIELLFADLCRRIGRSAGIEESLDAIEDSIRIVVVERCLMRPSIPKLA